jgi:hypothetical protein
LQYIIIRMNLIQYVVGSQRSAANSFNRNILHVIYQYCD